MTRRPAKRPVALSKLLSYVLRHGPKTFRLELDPAGWVDIEVLLDALVTHGHSATRDELLEVVRRSDKQRFALSPDGTKVRANQGHSIEVDLGYAPRQPPETLFHGTVERFLEAIFAEGLRAGQRQHVHLSESVELAARVGGRRGRPIILSIAASRLAATGHPFFRAPNGVWLTEHVPPQFIELTPPR